MKRKEKKEPWKQPKDYMKPNGEKIVFHYNREERLSRMTKRPADNNCFFCKKNMPFLITMINLVLVFALLTLYYNYVGRPDQVKDDVGLQYFISQKTAGKNAEFIFQIKNTTKRTIAVDRDNLLFEVVNSDGEVIYDKNITIHKSEFKPNEFYSENIVIDKPPKGNYIAHIYLDMSETPKKVEVKFNIR